MVKVTPRDSASLAGVSKFFFVLAAALAYIEKNLGSKECVAAEIVDDQGKSHYVLHSQDHPNDFDFQGKNPQELLDRGVHVIPTSDRTRAIRDMEGLRRRTGDDTVHQVMIVGPESPNGAEVIYLHE